jgi:hypothetical protein
MIGGKTYMFVCLDCQHLFQDPQHYVETHGLDTPPYEHAYGCPKCGGVYVETHKCDCCGNWIVDDCIKTNNDLWFCQDCYRTIPLEEVE